MSDRAAILVTGASGFLGGRVVEHLLSRGTHDVRVLVRSMGRAVRVATLPVEYHIGDVSDAAAFTQAAQGCEAVIHCASLIESGTVPEQTTTYRGVAAAAAACAETGAHLVHISSSSVYGVPRAQLVDEAAPQKPRHARDTYARAKIAAEHFLRDFAAKSGLKTAILQPTIIYGPHSTEWTGTPLAMLRDADIAMPAGDTSVCNAVYVDDVVHAALLAVEKCDTRCPAWLINGPELPTWTEFLSRHAALGTRGKVLSLDTAQMAALALAQNRDKSLIRTGLKILREKSDVRAAIMSTTLVSGVLDLVQKVVSREKFARIKSCLTGRGTEGASIPAVHLPRSTILPLRLPPPHFLDLARQSHRYGHTKAEHELGYQPKFGLDAAFEIIAAWARWSRLLS